ncbi:hypothetical protein RJ639_039804 [Escallonia herrerae]|uniref:Uncharacterized protein n=1 Tax=Escallonia herrerae TaxID=1293975 RepID=A0AA89B545_9ASTE|nr:hypothetical protein RJ639_039804 [Escallonia herrerae]
MKSTMNYFPLGISDQDLESRCIASICRAPLGMRRAGEDRARHAYDPELVSIGPFHHGNPALKLMEEHKSHVISRGLERINRSRRLEVSVNQEGAITMDSLAQAIEGLEPRARVCYSEAFDIHSEKFRHMMVLDGLFIIEVFDRFRESNGGISWDEAETDLIFRSRWMLPVLMLDLIKLENQLPFFVLEKLFDLTHTGNNSFSYTFTYLALYFYASFNPSMPKKCLTYHDSKGVVHLLELFHSVYKPNVNRCPRYDRRRSIGSIRDIRLADIKFKRGQTSNMLNIIYDQTGQAVLEIPQLLIDYSTGPLLRNLVALEQSTRSVNPYFTSYVIFFAELVNSPQDVEILRRGNVIVSLIGNDEEVATLLSNIRKEVILFERECYLSSVRGDISDRMGSVWYQVRGRLKLILLDPFGKYVALLITIAALYLTIIQTVFTVLQYV